MENLIYLIEQTGQRWLPFMINSSLQLSFFLMLVFVLSLVFRKQSARFLYSLWIIGLLKILVPPSIKIPHFFGASNFLLEQNIPIFLIHEVSPSATANTPALSYQGYLFLGWFGCLFLLTLLLLYKNYQFSRQLSRTLHYSDVRQLLGEKHAINLNIPIYWSPQIPIPFTRGLFKPRIFLPEQALSWSKKELEAIILHEYAHIKRKDILIIILQNLIQIVYFFHPLVWLANIQITRYREKACDDFAIAAMKGSSIDYSKFLLKSIDSALNWQPIPSLSNYFNHSKKFLLNRFEYILNRKEKTMKKFSVLHKLVVVGLIITGIALSCHKDKLTTPTTAVATTENSQDRVIQVVTEIDEIGEQNLVPPVLQASQDRGKIFVPYDEPPQPIGGFYAIQNNLHYPEIARRAGIEGTVIVYVKIDSSGKVLATKIVKSLGENNGCDEAAIAALKSVKWKPALQKDKPVTVWVAVPVKFKLSREKKIDTPEKPQMRNAVKLNVIQSLSKPTPSPMAKDTADQIIFVPYDKPPKPIGGFKAIQKNCVYPASARQSGIEGTVIVYVKIGVNGEIVDTKIVKPLGNSGCNEAAVNAIKSVKWQPAKQKGKPVAVWISVPVKFKLKKQ